MQRPDQKEDMEELIEKSNETYGQEQAKTVFTAVALALFAAIPVVYYFVGFEASVVTSLMCGLVVFALK